MQRHETRNLSLITGATGLLGGAIARELISRGADIRVLLRKNVTPPALQGLPFEVAIGDVRDQQSLERAADGCMNIYHSAAMVDMWVSGERARRMMWEVNVRGTFNVLQVAERAGVKRVLHVSTVDTIDLASDGSIADENSRNPSGRVRSDYAKTKRAAEKLAMEANVETVIVNPAFLLGPFDSKPSSGQLIIALAKGRIQGYPKTGGNCFIDVRDVAEAIVTAMIRGNPGERYILGNANLTYSEIFKIIASVLGVKTPSIALPKTVAMIFGTIGDIYGRISNTEPPVYSTAVRMGYLDHYYSSAKAIRELGLRQTPVDNAIEDAVRWFRENGMLP
ncbi:MAG: NAD-dependent epimerase/dehydratase family protein [Planctomycetes bacterium]|nr:NAD-dependent epimerase/dehydratase family protein [Planctomycetota bacterium]